MNSRYKNALDTLPPEVLAIVSKSLGGQSAFLWVPAANAITRRNRDAYIIELHRKGQTISQIAETLCISKRTVWRVLALYRKAALGLPSLPSRGEQ